MLVKTIKCACADQTRKQVVSIAEIAGVDPHLICQAAMWALSSSFAYRLNLMAAA